MDINNLQRTSSYSYRVDVDRIKQRLQQADKNSMPNQRQSDSVDISEKGRTALREKMSAIGRTGQKEYYVAADRSTQELTKEKELEMLDNTYETHSRLMATSTQIWSELQDFKVQIFTGTDRNRHN